jgi:hypothetical protein
MTRPNSSDMSGSIWSATSSQVFSTGLFLMGMIAAQMMHARGTSPSIAVTRLERPEYLTLARLPQTAVYSWPPSLMVVLLIKVVGGEGVWLGCPYPPVNYGVKVRAPEPWKAKVACILSSTATGDETLVQYPSEKTAAPPVSAKVTPPETRVLAR